MYESGDISRLKSAGADFQTIGRDYTQLRQDFKAQNRIWDREWSVFYER